MDSSQTKVLVANAALNKCGVARITTLSDTTKSAVRVNDVYPQLRDYCLAQHPWTFAKKTVALTPAALLWLTGTAYSAGDFVIVSGVVYECLISHTSSTFATDLAAGDWVNEAWLTATAYVYGDFVNQSGVVYVCMIPHTSGTFATDLAAVKWIAQTNVTITMPDFGDGVNLAYIMPTDWIKPNKWNFDSAIKRIEKNIIYSDTAGLMVKYTYQCDDPTLYSPEFIEAFSTKLGAEVCYDLTQNAAKGKELLEEFDWKLAQAVAADSQGDTPDQAIQDEWFIARLSGSNAPPSLPGQVSFSNTGSVGF